ncbi:GGDEF domain-containing protein [Treponema sp.]|uniref:GGDEF domain-containing protein n=1 Tax=Treponema sp. TaxID=166 RepID=UPI00298E21EF|nr:GGDEF domain-containing protein [Treponema sp.]MCQ2241762.1 GGDEF domain-containing protein [Treponema sp.]
MERKRFALFIDYIESVYSQRLIEGATKFFSTKDVEFLVFPCGPLNYLGHNFGYQRLAIASLINKNNIDGVIFICGSQETNSTTDQIHSYLKSFMNIPVICIGHDYSDYPCIINSSDDSMIQLAEHIIKKHKCRNPAIFVPKTPSLDILQRIKTFNSTLKKYNIEVANENIIKCENLSYNSAIDGLQDYKKRYGKFRFDTIACITDSLAFASIDYLTSCNVKIPKDVVITGFDDEDDATSYSPTLTTINQNVEKQSYYAAKILYKMVYKGRFNTDTVTIHSSCFFRQSCGCLPLGSDKKLYKDFKGKEHTSKNFKDGFFELSQWNYNKSSMIKIIQLYSNLESGILIDDLSERIESDFTSLKISKAAVVLFDKPVATDKFEYFPIPSKAHVLSSFDQEVNLHFNIKNGKFSFNPNQNIIPDGHIATLNEMTVSSIYCNSILYGYLLFKPGPLDPAVYGIAIKMLSSTIARASDSYEALRKKRALELENSNIRLVSVTDEMTGLLNRRGFISHGKEAIANSIKNGKKGLVLFGDMDGLKVINDTYGHAAGDTAIKAEAEILKSLFRSSDIIGRLGGDEFAIVAPELNAAKFAEMKKIIQSKCAEYNEKSGESFTLSISIGCVEFNGNEEADLEKLLAIADNELYKEKQSKYRTRRAIQES